MYVCEYVCYSLKFNNNTFCVVATQGISLLTITSRTDGGGWGGGGSFLYTQSIHNDRVEFILIPNIVELSPVINNAIRSDHIDYQVTAMV